MHQNAALSIVVRSPSTRLDGLLKQQLVGSPHAMQEPGLTDVISSTRESTQSEIVSDKNLRIVIADLVDAVRSVLQDEHESAAEYLRRASEILEVDREGQSPKIERRSPERAKPVRGGLAPWQVRRVIAHIEAHLDEAIKNRELAALVRLSSFHFCRAFRGSFADSPHCYIVRRRVERAQGLMLTTNVPLAQIAVSCGIADQAHFNRLFRRLVGETPGTWRRARVAGPESSSRAEAPKRQLAATSCNPLT
jgi:AraC family transcriptional regulator